jgi:hypothetical protein
MQPVLYSIRTLNTGHLQAFAFASSMNRWGLSLLESPGAGCSGAGSECNGLFSQLSSQTAIMDSWTPE